MTYNVILEQTFILGMILNEFHNSTHLIRSLEDINHEGQFEMQKL